MWKPFNKKKKQAQLLAVGKGRVLCLSEVNDEVFASKSMGDGYALDLQGDRIYSPSDGEIVACFPTGHALGIKAENLEIMVHIGIDTVELNGGGFHVLVQQGDFVKAGQPLVEIDQSMIKDKGYDITTMVILTSGQLVNITRLHEVVQESEEVATC